MTDNEIKDLLEYSLKQFSGADEHLEFGLKEIKHHIPEIRELKAKGDKHVYDEIADLYIWAKMLLKANNIGDDTVYRRIERFREKIKKALGEG